MRDQVVDPSWWDEIRDTLTWNIDHITPDLPEVITEKVLADEYWRTKLDGLYRKQYALWQVDYSAGAPLDELAVQFPDLLHNWIPVMNPGAVWAESARLLSIAVLVGYQEDFPHFWPNGSISARVAGTPDALSQWLADAPGVKLPDSDPGPVTELDLSSRFWRLGDICVNDPDLAQSELVSFMDDWYDLAYDYTWWGSHIAGRRGKPAFYCGFWCWEAAAIATKCNVDDSPLEDHEYYPYDLAHHLDEPILSVPVRNVIAVTRGGRCRTNVGSGSDEGR